MWSFGELRDNFKTKIRTWGYVPIGERTSVDILHMPWWELFKVKYSSVVEELPFFQSTRDVPTPKLRALLRHFDEAVGKCRTSPEEGVLDFLDYLLIEKHSTYYLYFGHYLFFKMLAMRECIAAFKKEKRLRSIIVDKVNSFDNDVHNSTKMIFFYEYLDLLGRIEGIYS